jgi:hypothetical protein
MPVHPPSFNVISLPKTLALAMVVIVALLLSACGGADIEILSDQQKAINGSPALQTIEARSSSDTTAEPHAVIATAIPEIDMESARKYLWVYLSKCITFATSDIEAVQLDGIWYVRGRLSSKHETGLWKVLDNGQAIEPYDQRAKDWLVTITGECSEEKMKVMTTPTPVVTGSEYASSAIWSLIVGCVSELAKNKVHASQNPSNAEWIITTEEIFVEALGRESDFGVWSLSYTGVPAPKDNLAKAWNGYLYESADRPACGPQYLVPIIAALPALIPAPTPTHTPSPTHTPNPTQTPNPTPIPKIQNGGQAENSVWAHLVPCFSDIVLLDFKATYDSSKSNWVVLSTKGATWSVGGDGSITASNASAIDDEAVVKGGAC